MVVPPHVPPAQMSPVVQRSPSLQASVLFVNTHAPATQASSVQTLTSSQSPSLRQLLQTPSSGSHCSPCGQLTAVPAQVSKRTAEQAWWLPDTIVEGVLAGVADPIPPAADVAPMPELQVIKPEPVIAAPLPPAAEVAPEPVDVEPRR